MSFMTQEKTELIGIEQEAKFYIMNVGSASLEEICLALRKLSPLEDKTYHKVMRAILDAYVETGILTCHGNFYYYK